MNCEHCSAPRARHGRRPHAAARPKTVRLEVLALVPCRTGDCHKLRCPECRAIFFHPVHNTPQPA